MKNTRVSILRTRTRARWLPWVLPALAVLFAGAAAAQPIDATFSYQGQLTTVAGPSDGLFDFEFNLLDGEDPVTAAVLGSNTILDVEVADGLFTVYLNFGLGPFTGQPLWLEIGVRPAGTGPMTYLYPPQRLAPAPYALIAARVDWSGILNIPADIDDGIDEVPPGVIVMWSGALESIPDGWALCDGTGGTPDLRDRFIMGVSALQNPGDVGGSSSHGHAVDAHSHWIQPPPGITSTVGNHYHSVSSSSARKFVDNSFADVWVSDDGHTHTTNWEGSHNHSVTIGDFWSDSQTAGTDTIEHLPPYYKLAFIMKLP